MLEEIQIDELKVLLQKAIVYESSCLSNQQYDVQMVFKRLETVDKDKDLTTFIEANRGPFPGVNVHSLLANLAITTAPLPVPPPGVYPDKIPLSPRPTVDSPPSPSPINKEVAGHEEGKSCLFIDEWSLVKPGQLVFEGEAPPPRVAPASLVLRYLGNIEKATISSSGNWSITPKAIIDNLANNLVSSLSSLSHTTHFFPGQQQSVSPSHNPDEQPTAPPPHYQQPGRQHVSQPNPPEPDKLAFSATEIEAIEQTVHSTIIEEGKETNEEEEQQQPPQPV